MKFLKDQSQGIVREESLNNRFNNKIKAHKIIFRHQPRKIGKLINLISPALNNWITYFKQTNNWKSHTIFLQQALAVLIPTWLINHQNPELLMKGKTNPFHSREVINRSKVSFKEIVFMVHQKHFTNNNSKHNFCISFILLLIIPVHLVVKLLPLEEIIN